MNQAAEGDSSLLVWGTHFLLLRSFPWTLLPSTCSVHSVWRSPGKQQTFHEHFIMCQVCFRCFTCINSFNPNKTPTIIFSYFIDDETEVQRNAQIIIGYKWKKWDIGRHAEFVIFPFKMMWNPFYLRFFWSWLGAILMVWLWALL